MAWINPFLLGRPTLENSFDVSPDKLEPQFGKLFSHQRTLSGALKERIFTRFMPTVQLSTVWFPKTQLDHFTSLLNITDTFLSFKCRDDWKIEYAPYIPTTTTTVTLEPNAITRLSAALVAAGGASCITITGVWNALSSSSGNPVGSGTNYYTGGGTYADATGVATLHTTLPNLNQVYVSFTYTGWLVSLQEIKAPITGGRVDLFNYNFSLVPA